MTRGATGTARERAASAIDGAVISMGAWLCWRWHGRGQECAGTCDGAVRLEGSRGSRQDRAGSALGHATRVTSMGIWCRLASCVGRSAALDGCDFFPVPSAWRISSFQSRRMDWVRVRPERFYRDENGAIRIGLADDDGEILFFRRCRDSCRSATDSARPERYFRSMARRPASPRRTVDGASDAYRWPTSIRALETGGRFRCASSGMPSVACSP